MKNVPSGVYFGWAWIEGTDTGRGVPHKAAVNVGYSPTFEGQENPEKIVEAHLILDSPITDFYSEIMRLSLIGFLRNEKKFDSFPELVQAITADVNNAKQALDKKPFKSFKKDGKFMSDDDWVGKSGGNTNASWEFEPVMEQSTTTEKA
mmetsp:Transcript_28466/g.40283  ORF Transcript_28466/g.40283 Transcript_28466/m.40283 type:complete len:149 (+) Transcript_28466:2-448(+)